MLRVPVRRIIPIGGLYWSPFKKGTLRSGSNEKKFYNSYGWKKSSNEMKHDHHA